MSTTCSVMWRSPIAFKSGTRGLGLRETAPQDLADHSEVRLEKHGFVRARRPFHVDALAGQCAPATAWFGSRNINGVGCADQRDASGEMPSVIGSDSLQGLQADIVHKIRQGQPKLVEEPLGKAPMPEVKLGAR